MSQEENACRPTRVFLSYARGDDEAFAKRLNGDLAMAGFKVWFDRESLMSRGLSFHQEIKDAIRTEVDRVVYVGGPKAAISPYVREEWQSATEYDGVVVTPILRLGDYDISVPSELGLLHCEDFRDDANYASALGKLVANLKQPNPKLGALHGVPDLPPNFLCRPDLMRRVRDALLVDLQTRQVSTGADAKVGMQGMGGIGKSVLAAALARDREVRQSYPDGVIWVACGQNLTNDDLLSRLHDVSKHLGGDAAFKSLPQAQSVLRELLHTKAVLLVLDDVWHAKDALAFDALGPRCRMLVTTRDAGILHALHGEHLAVSLFTEAESLQLLAYAISTKDHTVATADLPLEARAIVAECGCLPLALALCGGMAKSGHSWRDIVAALREADLEWPENRETANEQHRSIWNAMTVSYTVLSADEKSRFAELAVFPTDRTVPESAAHVLWQHTAQLSDRNCTKLLINLFERSLIQLDQKTATDNTVPRRFRLHDLLHDYAVRIAGDPLVLHRTLLDAYRSRCPSGWHSGPNDEYFMERLRDHLLAAGRGGELMDLLHDPRWMEVKLAKGLGYDLLKDFACVKTAAAAAGEIPALDRAAVGRCALIGRLLGNVLDHVLVDPSSVTAQLLLELQEHSPDQLPMWRARWGTVSNERPWFERLSVIRRHAVPYVAQTGQRQEYLHSLTFSADGKSLLYFDRDGGLIRWNWETGDQSRTRAPTQGGFVRSGTVASEQEVLLTDETTLWLARIPNVWLSDLEVGVWRAIYCAVPDHRLRALAVCPELSYAVFADDGPAQGEILRFRAGAEHCEQAWRLPYAGTNPLTNHIALGDGGALRAVGFGSGDLAVNTGFYGRAHRGGLYEAVFLPDRGLLATVGDDGTLALWNVHCGLVLRRELMLGAADCLDYCPAAGLLAVGHRTGAVTLLQFNGDDLHEQVLHPGVRGWVLCVRFSPCGCYLAVSGRSGVVRVLSVSTVLEELHRHQGLFLHIPAGPIEQGRAYFPTRVGFFLDQADHLFSTGPDVDSQHLPQKCETFCIGPQRGPIALLSDDIRFLDPFSGRPRHIHPLPQASRLAATLSPREDMLAVLESRRLVVYALGNPDVPPREVCVAALDTLRTAAGVTFPSQRNAVPLCFCDDGRSVAFPLEPVCRATLNANRTVSSSSREHRLCMIEVATGRLLWSSSYSGYCTALTETPSRRALALGLGTGRVFLFDGTDQTPQGSYFEPSKAPGVVLFALADGQIVSRLPLPDADDGVSGLRDAPPGLLLVGCRSGRVRAASLTSDLWLTSVVLPAPVLDFVHQGSALHCHAMDDGSTGGNWPVLHELFLRLPVERPSAQPSGEQA